MQQWKPLCGTGQNRCVAPSLLPAGNRYFNGRNPRPPHTGLTILSRGVHKTDLHAFHSAWHGMAWHGMALIGSLVQCMHSLVGASAFITQHYVEVTSIKVWHNKGAVVLAIERPCLRWREDATMHGRRALRRRTT